MNMKLVCLISGGIDSPVAAYMMLKKGAELVFVHFHPEPFVDEKSLEKTKTLVKKLSRLFNKMLRLYTIRNGPIMSQIIKNCRRDLTCVLCRRFMYRTSEKIARKEKAGGLLTGENLAQVASQTLQNLCAIEQAVKIPVVRPLIGFDKEEIIKLSKEIGTFETSILPGQCCNLTPPYPETRALLCRVLEEEKKLDLEKLVSEAIVHDTIKSSVVHC